MTEKENAVPADSVRGEAVSRDTAGGACYTPHSYSGLA